MIHNNLPKIFYFINKFDKHHIRKLDKKISIIFRNYSSKYSKELIKNIKDFCKKNGRKFYLANNINLAINLDLDGVYLPSFYKKLNLNKLNTKKKFLIMGSAHSIDEIIVKEKQGAKLIFLAPIFLTQKNNKFLNTVKFNLLSLKTNRNIIALGGIDLKNINQLKMTNSFGFAGISYFNNVSNVNK